MPASASPDPPPHTRLAVQGDSARIIREAAQWLALLHSGKASPRQWRDFDAWCKAHPSHQQAWETAQQLSQKLGSVSPALGVPVLTRPPSLPRRTVLKSIAGIGLVGTLAWQAHRHALWQSWQADYRTATGERQDITLPDGTRIQLNTATALDIHYRPDERRLQLYRGEILVQTAADTASPPRPFWVHTPQGRIQALGTRFAVRILPASGIGTTARENFPTHWQPTHTLTWVAVLEHRVAIHPGQSHDTPLQLHPGQQAWFDPHHIHHSRANIPLATGWSHGVLYADNMRLDDFLRELARHRPGHLRCAPEVAHLRLSGAYQLRDTDKILDIVAATLPIRIRKRPYWVSVEANTKTL